MWNIRILVVSLILTSAAFAEDALDLARWAPADSYLVFTWEGAAAAAPYFNKTAFGQLWAEPEVQTFFTQPFSGVMKLWLDEIGKEPSTAGVEASVELFKLSWHHPLVLALFPVPAGDKEKGDWPYTESGAVMQDLGPDAQAFRENYMKMDEKDGEKTPLIHERIAGVDFVTTAQHKPMYSGIINGRYIFALGREAARKIAEHVNAGSKGFSGSQAQQRVSGRFKEMHAALYLNVQTATIRERAIRLINKLQAKGDINSTDSPEEDAVFCATIAAMPALMGSSVGSAEFAMATGFNAPNLRDICVAQSDPDWPLGSDAISVGPIDFANLKLIPKEAMAASIGTFDLLALYKHSLRTGEKIAARACPESKVAAQASQNSKEKVNASTSHDRTPGWLERYIKQKVPVDIDQLLSLIGNHLIFYEDREFAGVGMTLLIELKDPKAFQQQLAAWLPLISDKVRFKPQKVGDQTMQVVEVVGASLPPMVFSPVYAVAGQWLMIGSTTTAGTRFLNQFQSSTAQSLADKKEIKEFLAAHAAEKLASLSFSNESAGFQVFYPSLAMFYPMITNGLNNVLEPGMKRQAATQPGAAAKLPIDFAPLPQFDTINKHLLTTIGFTTLVDSGRISQSNSGASINSGILTIASASLIASILYPSLARARELSKQTVCATNLRVIGTGMFTYANDHGDKFPPTLEELVKSKNLESPKVFICPSSDADPEKGDSSYVYIPGQGTDSDSKNVVVYEKDNHDGEGGNVLFPDSHVEFVKPYSKVEEMVKETKARLASRSR